MHAHEARYGRGGGGGRRERGAPWLFLLAFFAEDIFAAIFDALALVRLGLAPAADLGGDLTDLLLIDARNLDRRGVRRPDLDPVRDGDVDIVAVAELQPQILALGGSAIADAGDLEHLGEALGDSGDEVLDQRS